MLERALLIERAAAGGSESNIQQSLAVVEAKVEQLKKATEELLGAEAAHELSRERNAAADALESQQWNFHGPPQDLVQPEVASSSGTGSRQKPRAAKDRSSARADDDEEGAEVEARRRREARRRLRDARSLSASGDGSRGRPGHSRPERDSPPLSDTPWARQRSSPPESSARPSLDGQGPPLQRHSLDGGARSASQRSGLTGPRPAHLPWGSRPVTLNSASPAPATLLPTSGTPLGNDQEHALSPVILDTSSSPAARVQPNVGRQPPAQSSQPEPSGGETAQLAATAPPPREVAEESATPTSGWLAREGNPPSPPPPSFPDPPRRSAVLGASDGAPGDSPLLRRAGEGSTPAAESSQSAVAPARAGHSSEHAGRPPGESGGAPAGSYAASTVLSRSSSSTSMSTATHSQSVRAHLGAIWSVEVRPQVGRSEVLLTLTASQDGAIKVWITAKEEMSAEWCLKKSKRLQVSGAGPRDSHQWELRTVHRDMEPRCSLRGHVGAVHSARFLSGQGVAVKDYPTGVVSGGHDGTVRIWSLPDLKSRRTHRRSVYLYAPLGQACPFQATVLEGHSDAVWSVAVLPYDATGSQDQAAAPVLSASSDGSVRLWEPQEDWKRSREYRLGPSSVYGSGSPTVVTTAENSLAFSPNSSRMPLDAFLVGYRDGRCAQFSAEQEHIVQAFFVGDDAAMHNTVSAMAVDPPGGRFATARDDGDVYLYELGAGKAVACMDAFPRGAAAVCFSENGRFLVAGSDEGWISTWDIRKPSQPMALLHVHECTAQAGVLALASAVPRDSEWTVVSVGSDAMMSMVHLNMPGMTSSPRSLSPSGRRGSPNG